MKIAIGLAAMIVISASFLKSGTAQIAAEPWTEELVHRASETIANSVVQIETIGGVDQVEGTAVAAGPTTGLVISDGGYIVTSSYNLAQQPSGIFIRTPHGERLPAELVAQDTGRQLMLLKCEGDESLRVPEAVANDEMFVGQAVMAVGKAFDAKRVNVSTGILSATNRIWGRAIQSDAKISPANFGGPLVDLQGRVLGILVPLSPNETSAVSGSDWYDSGIGFAIPLEDINARLESWIAGNDLHPGKLGLTFQNSKSYAAEPVVALCPAGAPAARAGVQAGDKILEINGTPVERIAQARQILGPLYAGDRVDLVIEREQEVIAVTAELVAELAAFQHPFLGILPAADADIADNGIVVEREFSLDETTEGLFQPGDRISRIADHAIADRESMESVLANLGFGEEVAVALIRDAQQLTVHKQLQMVPAGVRRKPVTDPTDFAEDQQIESEVISLPEFPNECQSYIPRNWPEDRSMGLLIWLPEAGAVNADNLFQSWQLLCDRNGVIVAVPQSADDSQWQLEESEYIAEVVAEIRTRYSIDPHRIGIAGRGSGAAMGSVTAMRYRSVFRGMACVETSMSSRIRDIRTEPLNRQLVLFLANDTDSKTTDRIHMDQRRLDKAGFPVAVIADSAWSPQSVAGILIEWIDTLDRL